jgi:hypothetical protein
VRADPVAGDTHSAERWLEFARGSSCLRRSVNQGRQSVQISFANRKLQRTCESSAELERRFGARMGRVLGNRLNELAAAPTMAGAMAVPHLKLHQLSLTLVEPRRLILEIAHDPMPRDADGGIDLEAVTDILIIEVVDYH